MVGFEAVLEVLVDGKVVKEKKGVIRLKPGTEFSLKLTNNATVPVSFEFLFDGMGVHSLEVQPGNSYSAFKTMEGTPFTFSPNNRKKGHSGLVKKDIECNLVFHYFYTATNGYSCYMLPTITYANTHNQSPVVPIYSTNYSSSGVSSTVYFYPLTFSTNFNTVVNDVKLNMNLKMEKIMKRKKRTS